MISDTKSSGTDWNAQKVSGMLLEISTYLWFFVLSFSIGLSNLMMVIMTVLLLIVIVHKKQVPDIRRILLNPVVFLFLLFLISVTWSSDIAAGFSRIRNSLPLLLMPLLVQFWSDHRPAVLKRGILVLTMGLSIGFIITVIFNRLPYEEAYQLYQPFEGLFLEFNESDRSFFGWYVPFMERINFCNLLSYTAIALIFFYIQSKKLIYLLPAFAFLGASFVMGARGSMIATIVILPFLLFYLLKSDTLKTSIFLVLTIILIASVLSYMAYPKVKSRIAQTRFELEQIGNGNYIQYDYEHFTTLRRIVSWKHAFEVFAKHKYTGTGIGDYKNLFESAYENDPVKVPVNYHSQWLYILGVTGMTGTFLWLICLTCWLYKTPSGPASGYVIIITVFTFVIWIFDAVLLQKEEMMSLALFITFAQCLKSRDISST